MWQSRVGTGALTRPDTSPCRFLLLCLECVAALSPRPLV